MTEQEKLMYEILGQITTSDIPIVFKASHRYEIGWEKLVVLLQGTVRKELLVG